MQTLLQAPPAPRVSRFARLAVMCVPGVAAAALVSWLTAPGLSLTSDSIRYLAAGEHLAAEGTLVGLSGAPFANWPPLLPVVIAAIAAAGLPVPGTLRLLHAVVFAAMAVVVTRHLVSTTGRVSVAALGGSLLVLHPWLGYVHAHLWTEPLYLLWCLLALTHAHSLAGLTTFTALACLTRYAGVSLVPVGMAALLADGTRPVAARLRRTAAFLAGSLGPLGLWMWRNWLVGRTATGERAESAETLASAGAAFAHGLMVSIAPERVVGAVPDLGWLVLLVAAWGVAMVSLRRAMAAPQSLALLWAGLTALVLIAAAAASSVDPFDGRLLVPFVVVAALALPLARTRAVAAGVVLAIGGMGLARDAHLWDQVRHGTPQILRDAVPRLVLPGDATHVVSNWPQMAYLATRRHILAAPRRTPDHSRTAVAPGDLASLRRMAASGKTVLVWYDRPGGAQYLPLYAVGAAVALEPLATAPGVRVFLVRP